MFEKIAQNIVDYSLELKPGEKLNIIVRGKGQDFLGKEIPAGENVEMLVWFSNQAEVPMKLRGIFGALQSSMDASRFIQNVCFYTVFSYLFVFHILS